MDSRTIAEVLNNEHPQIVGLAMSYLDPEVASDVLKYLPLCKAIILEP